MEASRITRLLESLLCQTFTTLVIIINDGSTDNSVDIAMLYCQQDNRFITLSPANQGLSSV